MDIWLEAAAYAGIIIASGCVGFIICHILSLNEARTNEPSGELIINISNEEGSYDIYLKLNGLPQELADKKEAVFSVITIRN